MTQAPTTRPLILFGAFDRHNLGDLLLAHMAVADLAAADSAPRPLIFAGLGERDLTPCGGHKVHALATLAREWGDRRADLLHVGGELLTCESYEAAVMLQTPEDADAVIARLSDHPAARRQWARETLGVSAHLPYLAAKALFRHPGQFEYRAVGGVELDRLAPQARDEALTRLREADRISVRDHVTQGHLAAAGIVAELVPDPVSRFPARFGERIRRHAAQGEPAHVRTAFPNGYLAVQFAAEYGDDRSLDRIATHLDEHLDARGLVLFRAGAAPWHDDLAVYQRLAERLKHRRNHLFQSLDVWDIAALIAGAQGYCGSSLHGWILARAFGVETLPFPLPPGTAKLAAYVATWGVAPTIA
jgi:hypothetical protein